MKKIDVLYYILYYRCYYKCRKLGKLNAVLHNSKELRCFEET